MDNRRSKAAQAMFLLVDLKGVPAVTRRHQAKAERAGHADTMVIPVICVKVFLAFKMICFM